jgi:hypothetical protein
MKYNLNKFVFLKMVTIFILELKENKYYVGKTDNPNFRIEQHFTADGSLWTKTYKPIKVLETFNNCDNFDENKYTLVYMDKFGVNNVRDGSFCQIKLSKEETNIIQKMINGSSDKYYICAKKGHFVKDCPDKNDEWDFGNFIAKTIVNTANYDVKDVACIRCGWKNHTVENCFAKTNKYREPIIDESESDEEYSDSNEEVMMIPVIDVAEQVIFKESVMLKKI